MPDPMPMIPAEPREGCLLAVGPGRYDSEAVWRLYSFVEWWDSDHGHQSCWDSLTGNRHSLRVSAGEHRPCRWVALDALGFDPETGTVRADR